MKICVQRVLNDGKTVCCFTNIHAMTIGNNLPKMFWCQCCVFCHEVITAARSVIYFKPMVLHFHSPALIIIVTMTFMQRSRDLSLITNLRYYHFVTSISLKNEPLIWCMLSIYNWLEPKPHSDINYLCFLRCITDI